MEFRNTESRFEAVDDNEIVGWLEYEQEGDDVAMTHTIVPEEFSGRGIGKQLTEYAISYAAEHKWTVLPYCTFVQSYIRSHPDYLGLVPPDRRAEFSLEAHSD